MLGLALGFDRDRRLPGRSGTFAALGVVAALVLTIFFRVAPPAVRLPVGNGADGLGPWEIDEHGTRARALTAYGSLFFVPSVSEVEVPFRAPAVAGSGVVTVALASPGSSPQWFTVGRGWSTVSLAIPPPDPLLPRARINLAVEGFGGTPESGGAVLVGQPRIVATR